MNTTSCLCFVCCGVDVNEDLSVEFVRGGFGGAGMRSGGRQEMVCPPRRVILKTVPAVGL